MTTHELEAQPKHFQAVVDGLKTFEIRDNNIDRDFQVGDVLLFKEFLPCKECGGGGRVWSNGDMDPCGCPAPHGTYTGRTHSMEVIYMDEISSSEGQVAMSIVPAKR